MLTTFYIFPKYAINEMLMAFNTYNQHLKFAFEREQNFCISVLAVSIPCHSQVLSLVSIRNLYLVFGLLFILCCSAVKEIYKVASKRPPIKCYFF